jgi:argininosuccinate lyase
MLKGLPSSYNRDLQEDKEALFDSVDTVRAALELFAAMLPEIRVNRERMESAANDPALLATDLAEHLVANGIPFRDAYDAVGKLVAHAAKSGLPLNQVPAAELKQISSFLGENVPEIFDARGSLAKRTAPGAPSPQNIAARIKYWRQQLGPA